MLYTTPKDPEHFKSYYISTHLKLAAKIPGIRNIQYSFDLKGIGGEAPYFCIFEAEFDSEAALGAGFESPEGQATGADVSNYATGEVSMFHFDVK